MSNMNSILSVAITLVVGGGQFAQQLRHERRDSQRKTDFIANVSHELKTPLAGIRLNAELLAENRVTDAGKRRLMFDSILRESDRLTRMVDNLLEFGRLAKNHRRYAIKPVDLSEFALDLLHDPVVTMIAAGRLRVVRPEDGAGGKALADSDVLRQIVVNLVENAAKYTTGEIEILTSGSSVTVTDHGPGIPRKYEKRIFERFFRIDNSNSAKTSGSGLGLSIALDLARGMGGDLVYAPREGGGSRFTLTLPTFD